jgi:outer membrane protein W
MHKLGSYLLVACASIAATAQPAAAQQTLNFSLGYFTVRGEDARVDGDVLTENRSLLAFDVKDFNGASVGGEWLVPLGEYFEGGAGIAFSRRTVPSVYQDFLDSDGSEIEQDLRLRIVPIAFTFRVLPLGQSSGIQPYFGAGLGIFSWRYSESGEFVDFGTQPSTIFRDRFVASGSETGPVALGGIRFAGDTLSAGVEVRYHSADAALGSEFALVADEPRIDLGGWTYQFTIGFRFGG